MLGFVLQFVGCGGGGTSAIQVPNLNYNSNNNSNNNTSINNSNPYLMPNLGTPGGPPPLVGAPEGLPPGAATATFNLTQGWNLISFPFKSLATISGLTHDLVTFSGQSFVNVDAVAHPEQVNCGYGYFVYCDAATTVTATGAPNTDGTIQTVSLAAGWNLLGCPSASPLAFNNLSFTRVGNTRTLEDVSALTTSPTQTWLSSLGQYLSAGTFYPVDLSAGTGSLQPQQGLWVFTWQDVDINYNVVAPVPSPQINSLSTTTVNVGDTLTINGSGFGTDSSQGQVCIFGTTLAPAAVTAWSNTQITVTVPGGVLDPPGVMHTGDVVVFLNRYPSNRLQLLVNPGANGGTNNTPATGTGNLTGTVKDAATGATLTGCQLMLDSGENTASDASGNWILPNLTPGDHLLFASLMGYQSGFSPVTVVVNQTGVVSVTLQAGTNGNGGGNTNGGGSKTGTLYISLHGNSIVSPTDPPKRIDVQEYGNYNHHWTTGTTSGLNDPLDLTCSTGTGTTSPVLGVTYTIKLTWQSGATKTVTRTFTTNGQTETFYNP